MAEVIIVYFNKETKTKKMKRSKQRFDRPDNAVPCNVSGCRQFEGEDLCK